MELRNSERERLEWMNDFHGDYSRSQAEAV